MDETLWFYVDRAQQRHGPVPADAVAAAFRAGQVDDTSLVWRDGLAQWTPLGALRDAFGLTGVAALPPPVPTPAQPAPLPPPAPKNRNIGCLIALAAVAVLGIPFIAIIAAIALPAYQDYVIRSQVTTALADIRGHVVPMEEFFQRNGRCPQAPTDLAIAGEVMHDGGRMTLVEIGEAYDDACQIRGEVVGGNPKTRGVVIALTRQPDGSWQCTASLDQARYLPTGCELD